MKTRACTGLIAAVVLCAVTNGDAGYPSVRCQATKLKYAGNYDACLLRAQSKAVKRDRPVDVTKCDQTFAFQWQGAESEAGVGVCPSEGDQMDVGHFLSSCSQAVADALAGGPLVEDVLSCNADLTTCNGNLSSCNADVAACNCDCTFCDSSLASCQSALGTCNSNYATCSNALSTCSGNLSSCNASLATCTGGTAVAADVLSGTTFSSNAGLGVNGSMTNVGQQNITPGSAPVAMTKGYHDGTGSVAGDPDLVTANIRSGVDIFGVVGTASLPAGLPAMPLQTGQTTCYGANGGVIPCAGTGQDGEFQNGIPRSFTDNGDGTVTDDATGLMWEKISDDGSIHDKDDGYTWQNAFDSKIAALNAATFAGYNDWRLPNRFELFSLVNPTTANATFPEFDTGCVPGCTVLTCSCTRLTFTWSSTTYPYIPDRAWNVVFGVHGFGGGGFNSGDPKSYGGAAVRAVRGGL